MDPIQHEPTTRAPHPPSFEEARPFFLRDGALRDIFCDAGLDGWVKWLAFLATRPWRTEWSMDGEPHPPVTAFPPFDPEASRPKVEAYLPSGPRLNTFFFEEDVIDVDLSPRDFEHETQWTETVAVLAALGDVTGGEVRLSQEATRGDPWMVYLPATREWLTYRSPADHVGPTLEEMFGSLDQPGS